MMYLEMVENFETTSHTIGYEHLSGVVLLMPRPPKGLDDPEYPEAILKLDLFAVDHGDIKLVNEKSWKKFIGCTAYWDDAVWTICDIEFLDFSKSCRVWIRWVDNVSQGIPIQGEKEKTTK